MEEIENETSIMIVRDGEMGLSITGKAGDVEIEVIAKKCLDRFQLETGERIYSVGL